MQMPERERCCCLFLPVSHCSFGLISVAMTHCLLSSKSTKVEDNSNIDKINKIQMILTYQPLDYDTESFFSLAIFLHQSNFRPFLCDSYRILRSARMLDAWDGRCIGLLPRNKALLFVRLMTHDNSKKFLRKNNLMHAQVGPTGFSPKIPFRPAFENLS